MPTPNNSNMKDMWTSGRPSIKAYYPEIVILAIVTIAFIAMGARCSCSVMKKDAADKPKEASAAYNVSAFAQLAFAQDESIDLALDDAEAPEADDVATTADEDVTESADEESVDVAEPAQKVAEADEVVNSASPEAVAVANSVASKKGSFGVSKKTKLTLIWLVCLGVPLALWIWRGTYWLVQVYGTFYELRIDPDNPKATTFLVTRGILNKRTDSVHIGQIKDIAQSQSFVQKYFKGGVGTIELYTPSDKSDSKIFMKDMAEPGNVFKAIDGLRAQYWGKGGMQLSSGEAHEATLDDADATHVEGDAIL